jgi:prepilin-type N-terminal cleavage/methylation domain-containing protein
MKKKNSSIKKGFTIIELVVVVLIIAILAAIAFVSYESSRKQARDSRRIADITNLGDTSKMYFLKNGGLPSSVNDLKDGGYYTTAPADPLPGHTYDFSRDSATTFIVLHATMEDHNNIPSTNYSGTAPSGASFTCDGSTASSLNFCLKVAP